MAITNPYKTDVHKVFNRTFLQQTEVNVKFTPALSAEDFQARIVPFASEYFGYDLSKEVHPEANHAKVESTEEQIQYVFDLNAARIIIGPRSYDTFTKTILPLLPRLQAFLSAVAKVNVIAELNVTKRNAWPIKAKNAYGSFTEAVEFVFNKKYVEDFCSYQFPENPQPVQLTKMLTDDLDNGVNLYTKVIAEVSNADTIFLELALSATAQCVPLSDISADTVALNDLIYLKFIDFVSDDIIDMMEDDN